MLTMTTMLITMVMMVTTITRTAMKMLVDDG